MEEGGHICHGHSDEGWYWFSDKSVEIKVSVNDSIPILVIYTQDTFSNTAVANWVI